MEGGGILAQVDGHAGYSLNGDLIVHTVHLSVHFIAMVWNKFTLKSEYKSGYVSVYTESVPTYQLYGE